MTTQSLSNIPILSAIDRSGVSTTRFFLLTCLFGFVFASVIGVLGFLLQEGVAGRRLSAHLLPTTNFLFTFAGFIIVAITFYMARTGERDVQRLMRDGMEPGLNKALSRRTALVFLAVNLVTYYGAFSIVEVLLFPERSLGERLEGIITMGAPSILYFVTIPVYSLAATPLLTVIVQQLTTLVKIARHIEIDLQQLARYQAISNPFLRCVFAYTVVGVLFPLGLLPVEDVPRPIMIGMVTLFLIALALALLYLIPVLVLRSRIRLQIQGELVAVAEALQVQQNVNADLLIQQMYLESRPTWPLASEIQKIIVFGLLPPLAWVMAAVVENLLF